MGNADGKGVGTAPAYDGNKVGFIEGTTVGQAEGLGVGADSS